MTRKSNSGIFLGLSLLTAFAAGGFYAVYAGGPPPHLPAANGLNIPAPPPAIGRWDFEVTGTVDLSGRAPEITFVGKLVPSRIVPAPRRAADDGEVRKLRYSAADVTAGLGF